MKKFLNNPLTIALIGIVLLFTIAWATEWQDYNIFSDGTIADSDDFLVRNLSVGGANGTLERLAWSSLKQQVGNGATYWMASASAYHSNEVVVNNESSLYNALSDVDRFLEQNDSDPNFGVDETTQGIVDVYGGSSSNGGVVRWHNPSGDTGSEEYFQCKPNGTQFECGPESDPDLYIFGNDGVINKQSSASTYGYIATDTTCTSDVAGKVTVTPIVGNLGYTTYAVQVCNNGSLDTIASYNSATEVWTFSDKIISSAGIEATYLDGGVQYINTTGSIDLQTSYSTTCKIDVYLSGSTSDLITLPDDTECTSGSGKIICTYNRVNNMIYVAPGEAGDRILGAASSVDAGHKVGTDGASEYACFEGRSYLGNEYWTIVRTDDKSNWTDEGAP